MEILKVNEFVSKSNKIDNNPKTIKNIHASKIVNVFFDTISEAISRGERVELRGFGVFDVKVREARIARNPKNGEAVAVPAKKVPFFRMGKDMKDRINKKNS